MNVVIIQPDELKQIVSQAITDALKNQPIVEPSKNIAYSIYEAANYFHVSPVTFQNWKNKGFVKYQQQGRKLYIDLDGTMELLGKRRSK